MYGKSGDASGTVSFQQLGGVEQRRGCVDKLVNHDAIFSCDIPDKFSWLGTIQNVLFHNQTQRNGIRILGFHLDIKKGSGELELVTTTRT